MWGIGRKENRRAGRAERGARFLSSPYTPHGSLFTGSFNSRKRIKKDAFSTENVLVWMGSVGHCIP